MTDIMILNERDAKAAKNVIQQIDEALTSENEFNAIVEGFPLELVNGYRRSLTTQKVDLEKGVSIYEKAKSGDTDDLIRSAEDDIGVFLIAARIIKGLSQKDLARRVGLKEQQIQRYEADKYRSISLSNYKRMAHALGVNIKASLKGQWISGTDDLTSEYSPDQIKKVLKHAREHGWFEASVDQNDGDGYL
ncbi:MAG: helix-turn-helix domain-containing protein, partial [Alphaproteobacteria bacterium]|nr:helix-turn-helix domain-containing protein [Alphaproteobacteria bacterium]